MNSNKQEKPQLPTAEEVRSLIIQHVKTADELLMAGITLPAGHEWGGTAGRLSWWMGCPIKSSDSGASLFINRIPIPGVSADELRNDRATIHAEIRLFMQGTEYRDGRKVRQYRGHSKERFSAHIWVKTGPHWAFQSTSHLVDKEPFVYAQTVESLCAGIVERVNTALERAVQWIAQQNVERTEEACV